MQDNHKRYLLEKQQKYLHFLQAEEGREDKVRRRVLKETGRLPRERRHVPRRENIDVSATSLGYAPTPAASHVPSFGNNLGESVVIKRPNTMSTSMDQYVSARYRLYNVILDSSFRDSRTYPHANDFVVKLTEPLLNVAAIRILRTEFYQPSATTGYFVMNNVRIPLQLYNIESAYLYLNGYISTNVANETNTTFFGRVSPGTETYPAVTGDITLDPYVYVLQPLDPKLKRFHVKLLQPDGCLYAVDNARVVITLAVYCLKP